MAAASGDPAERPLDLAVKDLVGYRLEGSPYGTTACRGGITAGGDKLADLLSDLLGVVVLPDPDNLPAGFAQPPVRVGIAGRLPAILSGQYQLLATTR